MQRWVVGVDGTPASVNAVRYAVACAAGTGAAVEVIHVVEDYAPRAGRRPTAPEDVAAGRALLRAVRERLHEPADDVAITTHLRRGSPVAVLAAAGAGAAAVVVGSDRRPVPIRLLTGNVCTGVAARCPVPVVAVPATWQVERVTGVLVVGLKHPAHSQSLLAEAFALAEARKGRVVALHAWTFTSARQDDLVSDKKALSDWEAQMRRELDDVLSPWRRRYPDVEVELRGVGDQAAPALVTASAGADEMLIARRTRGLPATHLGSTARTVILNARCPVRVVPGVDVDPDLFELELEAAGQPLKHATA